MLVMVLSTILKLLVLIGPLHGNMVHIPGAGSWFATKMEFTGALPIKAPGICPLYL